MFIEILITKLVTSDQCTNCITGAIMQHFNYSVKLWILALPLLQHNDNWCISNLWSQVYWTFLRQNSIFSISNVQSKLYWYRSCNSVKIMSKVKVVTKWLGLFIVYCFYNNCMYTSSLSVLMFQVVVARTQQPSPHLYKYQRNIHDTLWYLIKV